MNLHSDKEAFKEIIALAAEHFGYEQSHIEKDYWVSKILRDFFFFHSPLQKVPESGSSQGLITFVLFYIKKQKLLKNSEVPIGLLIY